MDDNLHIFAPVVSMVTHSQFWELLIIWEQPERDWPMAIAFNVPEFLDRSIVLMLPMSLGSRRWVVSGFSHVSASPIYKLQCQYQCRKVGRRWGRKGAKIKWHRVSESIFGGVDARPEVTECCYNVIDEGKARRLSRHRLQPKHTRWHFTFSTV